MKKQSIDILSKIALFFAVFVFAGLISFIYLEHDHFKNSEMNKSKTTKNPSHITDNLTLIRPDPDCQLAEGPCFISFNLQGEITISDADAFETYVLTRTRHRKETFPVLYIDSSGGDINAAMKIGRVLRKFEGIANSSGGKCYSACILIIAGAPRRNWDELGVHRPYFSSLPPDASLSEVDKRYKTIMSDIKLYLQEMNISDELVHIMQSIPPNQLKFLSHEEEVNYGFFMIDPALDEKETSKLADMAGLTSRELRENDALVSAYCRSRFGENSDNERECRSNIIANIWVLGQGKVKGDNLQQLFHKLDTTCIYQAMNYNWSSCMKNEIKIITGRN